MTSRNFRKEAIGDRPTDRNSMSKVINEQKMTLPDGKEYTVRLMARESYTINPDNTNKGRDRGDNALRHGMRSVGFARGILTAANRTTVAGNHSMSAAEEEKIIDYWIEVDTDGKVGVVTRRIDWATAQDPEAIAAAIQDTRINELNHELMPDIFADQMDAISGTDYEMGALFFTDKELENIFTDKSPDEPEEEIERGGGVNGDIYAVTASLSWAEHEEWKACKSLLGVKSDKDAILELARR